MNNYLAHSPKCGDKLYFLPRKFTSKPQPFSMDLGHIKKIYKGTLQEIILKELIVGTEEKDPIQDMINIRKGIAELYKTG